MKDGDARKTGRVQGALAQPVGQEEREADRPLHVLP